QQMNALRLAAHDALPAQLTQETIVDLEHLRKMSLLSYSPASGYSPFSIAFRDFIISIAAKYFSGDSLPDRQTQDTLGAISELISQDESTTLEFKSSLRWDYRKSEKADYLELEVIGTIAAFLNTDGGTLIIGVDDDGKPLGLNNDYGTFTKSRGRDGFHRHLLSLVSSRIALEICTHVAVSFESCEGLDICRVVVKRSPIPVYVDKERKFYIRRGNANYTLDTEQTVKYCQIHWS
ncbi:MAG: ATP-binding protein, partial [Anaerolineae bacterium]|nr:ATP-binding protein [Anaerolineae bacterium]